MTRTAEKVIAVCARNDWTLTTAESATGGLIGHLLTEVSGASAVYQGGWVTYADRRKIDDLGVHPDLIARHGAVSQGVVENMAQGARKRAGTTFAVATSGIAGPGGGSDDKPVGTVWIAVAGPEQLDAARHVVPGANRTETKQAFAEAALVAVLQHAEAQAAHMRP